ncbi:ABC transporter substrate-binding protein [Chelatococcus reniformis]|uniref:ABC transporter substrate-binding protein n=1 Tax=Chelatococcus reniformis TaxID=1494448 RepID=A0A916TXJ4_9HYPH|nr:ABC transporter substrate-binding protein [Chelatococcus reniformis]GGC48443.1 ABC transporter substrate-binding protein [Chelatococcus reniformis]
MKKNHTSQTGHIDRREVLMGAVGAVASTAAFTAGSAVFPAPAQAAPSGKLRVAVASLMDQSIDPFFQSGGLARPINAHLYNSFFRDNDKGQRELDLAASYSVSADRKTVTFKMREDVVFWDGTPLTADDAAWSWKAFTTRTPPSADVPGLKKTIESVTATDKYTVEIKLFQPTPMECREFLAWFYISSKTHYEKVGAEAFKTQPMGTGPFKVVRNEVGSLCEMEANELHYRKDRIPGVRSLRLQVVPEPTTRIAQLRAGEVDLIEGITGVQALQLGADPNVTIVKSPATALLKLNFVEVGHNVKPWDDIRFREALVISVNQDEIVQGLLRQGKPSPNAHVYPGALGYSEAMFPVRKYDPARAKALIKEAGLVGFEFDLLGYRSSSYPSIPEVIQAIAGYWSDLGLKPKITVMESGSYFTSFVNRKLHGVAAQGWPFYNDLRRPAAFLITGANYGATDNFPEIDDRYRQLVNEPDQDRQVKLAQEMHKFCYDNFLLGTCPWSDSQWAVSKKVKAWVRPTGDPYTTRLESIQL